MSNFVALIGAMIGATSVIVAAILTARQGNRKQLNEIHVLVNSRLTEALDTIARLEQRLEDAGLDPVDLD